MGRYWVHLMAQVIKTRPTIFCILQLHSGHIVITTPDTHKHTLSGVIQKVTHLAPPQRSAIFFSLSVLKATV